MHSVSGVLPRMVGQRTILPCRGRNSCKDMALETFTAFSGRSMSSPFSAFIAGFILLGSLCGCGGPIAHFEPNRLIAKRMERENETSMDEVLGDIQTVSREYFGTPDEPRWPEILSTGDFVELNRADLLERAAGPTGRGHDKVERGIYRKHCVDCHGLSGDGYGPASALQSPYPRDFRRGTFKFKSTAMGSKPTVSDLRKTIAQGIAGTAMPAFHSLASTTELKNQEIDRSADHSALGDDDLDALVHYVRYLSIRGEFERHLLLKSGSRIQLDKGERLYDPRLMDRDVAAFEKQKSWIESQLIEIARNWISAPTKTIPIPDHPKSRFRIPEDLSGESREALLASISRGEELFQGTTAACAQCHGKSGDGNGALPDFDEWTKDWTIRAGIDPRDKRAWKAMKPYGALAPQRALARNFRYGVFRGGSLPGDLYRRLVGGIEGSPMPAVSMQPQIAQGLSEEDVWDLVNFVRSRPFAKQIPSMNAEVSP